MKKIFLTLFFSILFIPFGVSQDLPSKIPANGLLAYYPFNGNANDESGNGNHGTVNGATLSSNRNGDDNSAYDFQVLDWDAGNNGGDYIYIPHSSEFNFESFTLSAWVYRKSVGASNSPQHLTIMRKFEEGYNNPNGESWHFDIAHGTDNGGSILIGRVIEQSPSPAINFECASTNTIIEREWTNVIMTYSDKTIKTFINGVESCSSTNNNITLNTLGTSGISIGMSIQANGNWGPFDGSIDDIGIWNRALTEQEIQNLYNSSTGDIKLHGVVSAENNQIRNVADPTESLDAVNLGFLTEKLNELTQKINELESLIDSPQVQPPSEYVLSFDANNYVRFPNIDNYDNLDSMTIEFWAYLNSSPCTDESIIGTEYFATGWHFYPGMWAMIGGPNNAEAMSNVDAHGSCENYIESSKWFHIALQYNSELNENQWKLYIDGNLHEQKTGNISSIGDGGDIVINRHTWDSGSSSRLSGYIDEVRFSNIARYFGNFTPEIKQLQNDENTLLLLNFENTASNQVIDSSSNQNHGIINGTVNYVLRNDIEDSNAAN